MIEPRDYELIAQEVSNLRPRIVELEASVADLAERVADVQKVNARLEAAALTTARSLQQIAIHWDAVYEAMRRGEVREEETDTRSPRPSDPDTSPRAV